MFTVDLLVLAAATANFVYDGDGKRVKETNAYKNLAKGIVVSGSVAVINPDVITNGDTQADNGAGTSREYGYSSANGLQYVQIDLGALFPVNKVIVWHYNRRAHLPQHQDPGERRWRCTWTTVFDSAVSGEYAETLAGKTHTFTQQQRALRARLPERLDGEQRQPLDGDRSVGDGDHRLRGGLLRMERQPPDHDPLLLRRGDAGGGAQQQRQRDGWAGVPVRGSPFAKPQGRPGSQLTADPVDGDKLSELRYKAFGETRHSLTNAPTDRRYTGQAEEAGIGLYYYGSRFYDPLLSRWTSPDSIIPQTQGTQAWDKYAYVNNSPLNYTDPTGHFIDPVSLMAYAMIGGAIIGGGVNAIQQYKNTGSINISQVVESALGGAVVGGGIVAGGILLGMAATAGITTIGTLLCGDGDCTNEAKSVTDPTINMTVGNIAHANLEAQYLETIPEEQIPYVGVEATFSDTAGRFRPDIVNQFTGEILDYKPTTYATGRGLVMAQTQVGNYMNRLNDMFRDMRLLDGAPEYWTRIQYYNIEDYIP